MREAGRHAVSLQDLPQKIALNSFSDETVTMARCERDRELAQRRKRKVKLKKLMDRYLKSANPADKATISAKIRRVSPFYNIDERAEALKKS
jgi:hypothetical protein